MHRAVVSTVSRLWSRFRLAGKMAAIVVIGTLSLLGLFAYLGTAALNENTQGTLRERMVLAQTTARHIDYILTSIQVVLTNAANQSTWLSSQNTEENLAAAYQQLGFYATHIFLLDLSGRVIATFPPIHSTASFDQLASVQAVLKGQPFAVSRYLRSLDHANAATLAAAPIRDATGQVNGALVISIDLTRSNIQAFTNPIGLGDTGYIDLADLGGAILASTRS